MPGPFGEADRDLLELACKIFAARFSRWDDVSAAGISSAWRNAEIEPSSPEWAGRLICNVLLAQPDKKLCFNFLSYALGSHTNAGASLVDAAIVGNEALAEWIDRNDLSPPKRQFNIPEGGGPLQGSRRSQVLTLRRRRSIAFLRYSANHDVDEVARRAEEGLEELTKMCRSLATAVQSLELAIEHQKKSVKARQVEPAVLEELYQAFLREDLHLEAAVGSLYAEIESPETRTRADQRVRSALKMRDRLAQRRRDRGSASRGEAR